MRDDNSGRWNPGVFGAAAAGAWGRATGAGSSCCFQNTSATASPAMSSAVAADATFTPRETPPAALAGFAAVAARRSSSFPSGSPRALARNASSVASCSRAGKRRNSCASPSVASSTDWQLGHRAVGTAPSVSCSRFFATSTRAFAVVLQLGQTYESAKVRDLELGAQIFGPDPALEEAGRTVEQLERRHARHRRAHVVPPRRGIPRDRTRWPPGRRWSCPRRPAPAPRPAAWPGCPTPRGVPVEPDVYWRKATVSPRRVGGRQSSACRGPMSSVAMQVGPAVRILSSHSIRGIIRLCGSTWAGYRRGWPAACRHCDCAPAGTPGPR